MKQEVIFFIVLLSMLTLTVAISGCKKKDPEQQTNEFRATKEPAQSIPGKVYQKAQGVECQSNLSQLRQLIQIKIDETRDESSEAPTFTSLSEIGAPSSVTKCPISKKPYTLNEGNRVSCTFEGHENF